jgi:hypothetical protein
MIAGILLAVAFYNYTIFSLRIMTDFDVIASVLAAVLGLILLTLGVCSLLRASTESRKGQI